MSKILEKKELQPNICEFTIEAPVIAKKCESGQFVIVHADEYSERVPMSICDFDREAGTIVLVIQVEGNTTKHICEDFNTGDELADVVGPLGTPFDMGYFGTVVVVGGGLGIAPIYTVARRYKKFGNRVIAIIGAKNKDCLIWRAKMEELCNEVIITTNDGSEGRQGNVTEALADILKYEKIPLVMTIGPVAMMKSVADMTKKYGIHTLASLNAIMLDGTGMCGGCRVLVDGESKFACVDGPEFDAHKVDFENLLKRRTMYNETENKEYGCGGHCKCVEE